jgi:hypothetical protein
MHPVLDGPRMPFRLCDAGAHWFARTFDGDVCLSPGARLRMDAAMLLVVRATECCVELESTT